MGISEIIAELQSGNGSEEQVGEALVSPHVSADDVGLPPEVAVQYQEDRKTDDVPPSEEPVVEVPVKAKRGRKTVYDTTNLAVGESLVYDGKLSSGRVLASLKGGDGKKFQATETEGVVRITRKV